MVISCAAVTVTVNRMVSLLHQSMLHAVAAAYTIDKY